MRLTQTNLYTRTKEAHSRIRTDARLRDIDGKGGWRGRKGKFNPTAEYCLTAMSEYLKRGNKITALPAPADPFEAFKEPCNLNARVENEGRYS